ncbi:MAG: hypothetical protein R3C56_15450 [Pirellulaceae bacterium]
MNCRRNHLARNPFEVAHRLDELRQQLVQLEAQCTADRQAHAEAARAVAGAERQRQAAEQLVRQSQTDGIPDSQDIVQANTRIAALTRTLASVAIDLETPHGDWKVVNDSGFADSDGHANCLRCGSAVNCKTPAKRCRISNWLLRRCTKQSIGRELLVCVYWGRLAYMS